MSIQHASFYPTSPMALVTDARTSSDNGESDEVPDEEEKREKGGSLRKDNCAVEEISPTESGQNAADACEEVRIACEMKEAEKETMESDEEIND